ncbi:MAG: Gfo/Idh/MocA family oxidoreductase [Candidatus Izemoplasma sp.]|nr:Gfo/Idh/MocA family oxidoreductase [Candidatus Izemoplasma sp.]
MVRFGVVGAGDIAHVFAQDIKHVKDAKLVAIASRSLKRAKEFQAEYDIPLAFEGYEEMAKSDEIDAVYIATPHNFHREQSLLFMTHKKHVLCEKPITVNEQQLTDLMMVAKQQKVALMEAMWTRFLPSTKAIIAYVNNNNVGNLLEASLPFGYALIDDYDPKRRLLNPDLAGGSILDIGVYPVHYINNFVNINQFEWNAEAEMTETGVDATCIMTTNDDKNVPKITLKSSIKDELSQHGKLVFEHATINIPDFSRSSSYIINGETFETPFKGNGFVHEIESFIETINNKKIENDLLPFSKSLETTRFMDKIRQKINLRYPFE